jgi:MASE1
MDANALRTFARGIAIAAAYCVAFLISWRYSVDQWYLPAGLRLASLLLLPMRYWPYVFAGDAAALLSIRIPKAEQYSVQWAYLSPFLFIPVYSLVPYYFQKKLANAREMVLWSPLIASIAAIVTSIWAMTLNYTMAGPRPDTAVDSFVRFAIGDYFGIMIVMLPILLWQQRGEWRNTRRHIAQSIAIATLTIAALYAAALIPGVQVLTVRVIPLALMLIAIAYLTLLHGWHGAAVGTLLVITAIAFVLPRIEMAGAADDAVLMAQIVLAIASAIFLVGGVHFSNLHERSGESLRNELLVIYLQQKQAQDEAQTMGTVRNMVQSFEQQFREKSLLLAYARDDLDAYRNAVAQTLKDEGLYRQAMDAISTGVESSRALVRHSELLYPFEIETYGLHAVLLSEYFQDRWSARIHLRCTVPSPSSTKRPPLSLPLQLAAYRAICSGMGLLASMQPIEYRLRVRHWRRGGRKGLTVFIDCSPTTVFALTSDTQRALQALAMLARAYDGTFQHRHTHRIGFLISEPHPTP